MKVVQLHRQTIVPDTFFFSCTGNCKQGRACDCVEDVPIEPIESVEEEHPLVWLLYGVVILGTIGYFWLI